MSRIGTAEALTRRVVLGGIAAFAAGPALAAPGHPARPLGIDLQPLAKLVTQKGLPFDRRLMRIRPTVVCFGYTRCPEVCPTALHDLSAHLAALGPDGDRVLVLFVTVDPERDTPPVLDAYLQAFDPRIVALTGTPTDVAAVADAFSAPFAKADGFGSDYSMRHSALLYCLDRYGLLATTVAYAEPAQKLAELSRRLLLQ